MSAHSIPPQQQLLFTVLVQVILSIYSVCIKRLSLPLEIVFSSGIPVSFTIDMIIRNIQTQ